MAPVLPKKVELAHRSGFEDRIVGRLSERGIRYVYEPAALAYEQPVKKRKYWPDFVLLDNGIIVEAKGWWPSEDRGKHLLVKDQYPELDIRFVFGRPSTRISKRSRTTYADYVSGKNPRKFVWPYAAETIPDEWVAEEAPPEKLARLRELGLIP